MPYVNEFFVNEETKAHIAAGLGKLHAAGLHRYDDAMKCIVLAGIAALEASEGQEAAIPPAKGPQPKPAASKAPAAKKSPAAAKGSKKTR